MLHYSGCACLEHSNFLKVKYLNTRPQVNESELLRRMWPGRARCRMQPRHRSSTTSLLTATTLIYATGAGITAAAGTRLALQWVLANAFTLCSFQSPRQRPVSVFLVTTSLSQDWVICAPAAFLRCGSRLSGSLSGIEP